MVSQKGPRVVRSDLCKRPNSSWKRAKRQFWGQLVLFQTKFLKFGSKWANLATLALIVWYSAAGAGAMHTCVQKPINCPVLRCQLSEHSNDHCSMNYCAVYRNKEKPKALESQG